MLANFRKAGCWLTEISVYLLASFFVSVLVGVAIWAVVVNGCMSRFTTTVCNADKCRSSTLIGRHAHGRSSTSNVVDVGQGVICAIQSTTCRHSPGDIFSRAQCLICDYDRKMLDLV